eukprot:TRINITY_DN25534_c0_g1_i1.p1 TRINITY_DN25534_c0_g1~~TRINITY_DN25534_c0_g1_i1.p1  ORF type:complete len:544 (+),score=75.43 TRINITY_DN25534_c0_g1_i1:61-1692(+)
MAVGNSAEVSVDYDAITGLPRRPVPPSTPKLAQSTGRRPLTATSTEATSALESVNYNALSDGAGHNADSDGLTYLGNEVKERFRDMRTAFLHMDANRDGRISKKELLEMCKKWNIPTSEAQRIMHDADMDHNGTLSFNEFAQRFDPYEGNDELADLPSGLSPTCRDDRPINSSGWGEGRSAGADRPIQSAGWDRDGSGGNDGNKSAGCMDNTQKKKPGSDHGHACSQRHHAEHDGAGHAVDHNATSPNAAGSGSRAARALGDSDECAKLRARNAELEKELASCKARISDLEKQLAEASTAKANHDVGQAGQGRKAEEPVTEAADEPEEVDDPNVVYVYGTAGDKQSVDMQKALRAAGVPFQSRDFEKDKRFLKIMEMNGCPQGAKKPPIVCLGTKVWWDDPAAQSDDSCIVIPFASATAMELRRAVRTEDALAHAPAPVRADADFETEVEERFRTMQQAFLNIDEDSDGRITLRELLAKCKTWNIPASEATRILGEADQDLDQTLSFDEFAKRFGAAYNCKPPPRMKPSPKACSGKKAPHGLR